MERKQIEAHRKALDAINEKIEAARKVLKGEEVVSYVAEWVRATLKVDESVYEMSDLMLRKAEYKLLEIEFLESRMDDAKTEVSVMTLSDLKKWKEEQGK